MIGTMVGEEWARERVCRPHPPLTGLFNMGRVLAKFFLEIQSLTKLGECGSSFMHELFLGILRYTKWEV